MFLLDTSQLATAKLELIADKIVQPAHLPRVPRPRLLNLLRKSLVAGTSTIINGRAGTGKSTLAVDFANNCGRTIAWYKVDAPDADPVVFFHYLIGSIRRARPGFGVRSIRSLLEGDGLERLDELAEAFVYELAEDQADPLLIVIDDLHHVSDSDWLVPFFNRLLPLLPTDVHVLITSRSLPPAPLWRMRSKQSLVVIEEETLAFTRSEAVLLFESFGLGDSHAGIALDHTHGRAAALYECAEFLIKSQEPSLEAAQH